MENLEKSPAEVQFQIINELTNSEKLKDIGKVEALNQKLHATYRPTVGTSNAIDTAAIGSVRQSMQIKYHLIS